MADLGVNFIRNTKAIIDATPIVDGQVLWTVDQGVNNKIYTDYGATRVPIGGMNTIDQSLDPTSTNAVSNKATSYGIYGFKAQTTSINEGTTSTVITQTESSGRKLVITATDSQVVEKLYGTDGTTLLSTHTVNITDTLITETLT